MSSARLKSLLSSLARLIFLYEAFSFSALQQSKSLDQANSGVKASKHKHKWGQEVMIPREDNQRKPSVLVFLLLVLMLMMKSLVKASLKCS